MEIVSKVTKTSLGVREMLFEELDSLRSGRTSPQRAHAIAKISSQIISSVKIELDYSRFLKDNGISAEAITPLKLA